ncbi:MAG: hypothetical protein CBC91_00650 [Rickettsiales bacterium TMED131]|nr:MAG: hypothetical protein CBC91_00650 [Rickettsiales bacterium TMED131]|tara:strand:+ start:2965 stop:4002 length:1038 start_codon:yes stop_codon:yes gene_type:complete
MELKTQVEPNDIYVQFLKETPEIKSKMIFLGYTLYHESKQIVSGWNNNDFQEEIRILKNKLSLLNTQHSEEIADVSQQVKERTLAVYQHECKEKEEKCNLMQQQLNDMQVTLLKQHQVELENKIENLRSQYETKLEEERSKTLKYISVQENSSIKGQQGEEYTFHQLNMLFPKYNIHDTHNKDARGDFLVENDTCNMMVEAKQYNKNVPLVEIEKFHRDMVLEENKDIHCGVLISLDSGICAKDDFHMEFIGEKPVIYLHHTRNQMYHIRLAFTIFEIMLRQDNLHTKMESAVTVFKGLAKKLKRNYNKQKSNIDKYRAEQLKIMSEQQQYIIDLYSHIGQTIQF